MKVRVRDVAAKAGVSPATVSNALNGRPGVSQEIAQRIRLLASEMGYEGVKTASKAQTSKSYVRLVMFKRHGLVVMDTQFFMELVESIERECQAQGHDLVITHIHIAQDRDYRERIRAICSEECAGVIVMCTEMLPEDLHMFDGCVSPFLALDNLFRHERVNSVVMNNYDAGYRATNALFQAGHSKIAHITSTVEFSNMRYRRKGYEAAMDEHGLKYNEESFWRVTPTLDGAYRDMLALLEQGRALPTAFFAGNDIMAVGCMRAIRERGYTVPDDISIIGMDDLQICQFSSPQLSTIHVYRQELGIVAVQALMMIASHPSQKCFGKCELSVELVSRESVSAPKA